jgi:spermidine/putrescine transport system permease protein
MIRVVSLRKATLAGVAGAVAWDVAARGAQLAGLESFDIVHQLGTLVFPGGPTIAWWVPGMLMHALVGAIWAIFYAYFFWSTFDWPPVVQGLAFSLAPTLLALLIAYPLAYAIAFRAGRFKLLLLFAVIAPFFTTYLIRTIAWKTILFDDGTVVNVLQALGFADDGRVLATSFAVIAGLTYNFLPFMILPLYASLERIDKRMLEAGYDLYGRRRDVFLRVTLPLSMPGVVAGTLLTFIPAAGDFINAELLGTPQQYMIGNVIQSRYLEIADYPTAAALSFLLMAFMLIIVLIWARVAGTEALLGTEGERT